MGPAGGGAGGQPESTRGDAAGSGAAVHARVHDGIEIMNLSSKEIGVLLGAPVRDGLNVSAITSDSRRVTPGSLFVALRGVQSDGHNFAKQAAERGAVAIVGDQDGVDSLAGLPYVRVPHARRTLGLI